MLQVKHNNQLIALTPDKNYDSKYKDLEGVLEYNHMYTVETNQEYYQHAVYFLVEPNSKEVNQNYVAYTTVVNTDYFDNALLPAEAEDYSVWFDIKKSEVAVYGMIAN